LEARLYKSGASLASLLHTSRSNHNVDIDTNLDACQEPTRGPSNGPSPWVSSREGGNGPGGERRGRALCCAVSVRSTALVGRSSSRQFNIYTSLCPFNGWRIQQRAKPVPTTVLRHTGRFVRHRMFNWPPLPIRSMAMVLALQELIKTVRGRAGPWRRVRE